jgi:delta8-fatty-acid desaturase
MDFRHSSKEVISRLGDVAKQVRLMEECRKSIAEGGVFSDHHH